MLQLRSLLPRTKVARRGLLLLLIMGLAAFFRLYRLETVPPGVTHDEADTGFFVASVLHDTPVPVDVPYGYAYKPFTKYTGALFMALFGPTDLALRLHSAFFGTALVLLTYLWACQAFGGIVALGAAALMAVSYWPVSTSRFALNPPPALALFTAAAYFLWRGLYEQEDGGRWWAWTLFAVLLAASLYAYETAIAAAPSFVVFFVYLALVDRARFRRHGVYFAGALVAATLLAAPHLLAPSTWARATAQAGPLQAARLGEFRPLLRQAVQALGTYSFRGDSLVTYNIPGRPILDPVTSFFFVGGIVLSLWRWRIPSHAFALFWLVFGTAPALVTGAWSSTLHSGAAKVPVFVLSSMFAVEVARYLSGRFGRRLGRVFASACLLWLFVIAGITGYDYFARWGQAPETRAAYFSNLGAIMEYLGDTEYTGMVALSSPFPDLPHDPFIARLRLNRDDLTLRWFDGQRALVFPKAGRSLLVLPSSASLAPILAEQLDLHHVERVEVRPDDVDPYFDVFEWNPTDAVAQVIGATSGSVAVGEQNLELPVEFGEILEFLGYQMRGRETVPGGEVSLVTFWRVQDPQSGLSSHPMGPVPEDAYGHSATIFAHIVDGNDQIVAQEDRLDAPAWDWHSGDVVAQVHRLKLGPDTQPGVYRLEVGIYDNNDPDLSRFPVVDGGHVLGDHVLLSTVEVTGS